MRSKIGSSVKERSVKVRKSGDLASITNYLRGLIDGKYKRYFEAVDPWRVREVKDLIHQLKNLDISEFLKTRYSDLCPAGKLLATAAFEFRSLVDTPVFLMDMTGFVNVVINRWLYTHEYDKDLVGVLDFKKAFSGNNPGNINRRTFDLQRMEASWISIRSVLLGVLKDYVRRGLHLPFCFNYVRGDLVKEVSNFESTIFSKVSSASRDWIENMVVVYSGLHDFLVQKEQMKYYRKEV